MGVFSKACCPKCGSVYVERLAVIGPSASKMRCRESKCGFSGSRTRFFEGGPETGQRRYPNQAWRDGSALSMDGRGRK